MRIGSYEVSSEIGRGATGSVLRASTADGREVAIKLLMRATPDSRARFTRERTVLDLFGEAEGFVSLLDSGDSPQGPYLVMPLVSGGTLRDRLRSGPLGVEATIELGIALGRALGRAHERGIVHRDLKPDNIMFTAEGKPLVADLGLAKHFCGDDHAASGASLSRTGDFKGTAGYMAPEQINDSKRIGPASDVFALGTILHECLTAVPLFSGESLMEIATKVDSGVFASLRKTCPEAPRWLADVIGRCLARDPEDRFADGRELARALEEAGSGAPPGPSRAAVVALAAVSALVIAGGSAYVAASTLRDDAPSVATRETAPRPRPRDTRTPVHAAPIVSRIPEPAKPANAARVSSKEAADLEARGMALVDARDPVGAIALLEKAVAADPGRATAWFALAGAHYNRGDYRSAMSAVDKAIEIDPQYARAYEVRGATKSVLGSPADSFADLERAVALDPKLASAWSRIAVARERTGDLDGAMQAAAHALDLSPELPSALVARARIEFSRGDLDAAIADTTRVIDKGVPHQGAFFTRGACFARREIWDRALADFDRAVELSPNDAQAFYNRAAVLRALHRDRESLRDATRALELSPNDPMNWIVRGLAKAETGDKDGAIADLEKALAFPGLNEADGNVALARRGLRILRGEEK